MSDIGLEHLAQFTDVINARLKEFGLHNMPLLSAAHVRIAHDEIKRFYQEHEVPWAMQRISDATITAEMAMKLSKQGYEIGYEAAKKELEPAPAFDIAKIRNEGYEAGYQAANRFNATLNSINARPDQAVTTPNPNGNTATVIGGDTYPDGAPRAKLDADAIADSIDAATGIADDAWCDLDDPGEHDADDELLSPQVHSPTNGTPPLSPEFVELREDNKHAIDELALKQSVATEPVAPLVPRRPGRPRTIAESDDLEAELSAVIVALQAMAVDGAMPPILTWDGERPEHLPRWEVIQRRHGVTSWAAMARMADLEYGVYRERITERSPATRNKPGPKPGSGKTPALDEICAELVRQSVGTGIMPSMNTFDSARPAAWPLAWGLVRNLGTSWNALAETAGLKPRPHGRPMKEPQAS